MVEKLLLTLEAEAIELAGDVSDEALGASAKAEFGDQVTDHVVEGLVVSFHCLRSQHVLPQEAPDGLPFLPFAGDKTGNYRKELGSDHKDLRVDFGSISNWTDNRFINLMRRRGNKLHQSTFGTKWWFNGQKSVLRSETVRAGFSHLKYLKFCLKFRNLL